MATIQIPDDQLTALVRPLLERVGAELAGHLLSSAAALVADRAAGYMDKEGAAAYLGLKSERALESWMKPLAQGGRGLPHLRFGATVRFRRDRIDAWSLAFEVNPPPVSL